MSKVTIVSCFYPLERSKHYLQEYFEWINNFLKYVDTPIVMFSHGEMISVMKQLRSQNGLIDKLHFIDKPFSELKFSSPEWIQIWEAQVKKSNFASIHNQELFRIWANKSFFVEEAIRVNPFNSEIFAWCDAGCWRDSFTAQICGPSWPLPEKVVPNRLHIVAMSPIQPWIDKVNELPADATHADVVNKVNTRFVPIVGGTILIGDKTAWQTWIPTFEKTLELYIENEHFAGDDQSVITSAALWLYKRNVSERPLFFRSPGQNSFIRIGDRTFGNAWFCFQEHFSRIDFTLDTY